MADYTFLKELSYCNNGHGLKRSEEEFQVGEVCAWNKTLEQLMAVLARERSSNCDSDLDNDGISLQMFLAACFVTWPRVPISRVVRETTLPSFSRSSTR